MDFLYIAVIAGDGLVLAKSVSELARNVRRKPIRSLLDLIGQIDLISAVLVWTVALLFWIAFWQGWMHGTLRLVFYGALAVQGLALLASFMPGRGRLTAALTARDDSRHRPI